MMDSFSIWADIYDEIYADITEDINFYLLQARHADGPILELGSGTGRITLPLLNAGHDISGLDVSKNMMDSLLRKIDELNKPVKGKFVIGDMAYTGDLFEKKFKLVIVPYRGFQSLLSSSAQEQCLVGLRNILDKDHKVIINIFTPNLEMFDQNSNMTYKTKIISNPHSGEDLSVWHRTKISISNQTLNVDIKVETSQDGSIDKIRYAPFKLRYIYPYEAKYLFHYCGYEIVDLIGDYDGTPYNNPSQDMIWTIRKREIYYA